MIDPVRAMVRAGLLIFGGLGLTRAGEAQPSLLLRAGWLAGCWEARAGSRVTLEMWMPPAGGLMIGGSRTSVGDSTREFEHGRIRVAGNRLVYTAIPSGQREASFRSIMVSDTLLGFENLQHDFPQRILYRKRGADSIIAQVEGGDSGQNNTMRGITIPMRRVSCDRGPG